jgi:hypothetical protein
VAGVGSLLVMLAGSRHGHRHPSGQPGLLAEQLGRQQRIGHQSVLGMAQVSIVAGLDPATDGRTHCLSLRRSSR